MIYKVLAYSKYILIYNQPGSTPPAQHGCIDDASTSQLHAITVALLVLSSRAAYSRQMEMRPATAASSIEIYSGDA
jgi:hypothetical protein